MSGLKQNICLCCFQTISKLLFSNYTKTDQIKAYHSSVHFWTFINLYLVCSAQFQNHICAIFVRRGLFRDLKNLQKVLLLVSVVYQDTQLVSPPAFLNIHTVYLPKIFTEFHILGGAAGMVSRITGSVGKGLAAITMDKEYQQKRREEMNRPTKDFGESLAKGGIGFFKVLSTSSNIL